MKPWAALGPAILLALGACAAPREDRPAVLAMLASVRAGDLARCQELAAAQPSLVRTREHERLQVPLHLAAVAGQREIVAWLLEQGAEVDPRDRYGSAPLSGAAYEGRTDVAELLLEHGADPNAHDEDGDAALNIAADRQHLDTARLLVARGARIEGGPSPVTPLTSFARHADVDGVEWALAMGATLPTRRLLNGWTVLHWLARGSSVSREEALASNLASGTHAVAERSARELEDARYRRVFELLRERGASLDARANDGATPLHLAAEADNLAVATALLEAGASVDPRQKDGMTPLHLAAEETHADLVRLLAAHGADVDARTEAGFTPLITATRWGDEEAAIRDVVAILCSAGADVDARKPGGGWGPAGDDGLTALQQAAQRGHLTVVAALLDHGASVNLEFDDGRTPLYWAARDGHRDVVAALLARGADVNAEAKGRTALDAARAQGHGEVVALLLEHGARQ